MPPRASGLRCQASRRLTSSLKTLKMMKLTSHTVPTTMDGSSHGPTLQVSALTTLHQCALPCACRLHPQVHCVYACSSELHTLFQLLL
jgi:hypothetical protein